jgi:hypothetical protein
MTEYRSADDQNTARSASHGDSPRPFRPSPTGTSSTHQYQQERLTNTNAIVISDAAQGSGTRKLRCWLPLKDEIKIIEAMLLLSSQLSS